MHHALRPRYYQPKVFKGQKKGAPCTQHYLYFAGPYLIPQFNALIVVEPGMINGDIAAKMFLQATDDLCC